MNHLGKAILLTGLLGVSLPAGDGVAGTYVYRDEDGNEVRELPRTERRSREAKAGRGDAGRPSRRRGTGESPAAVIVVVDEQPSSGSQR